MEPVKIIYSKKLAEFLLLHDCVLVDIIPHPYIENFKAWVFIDDDNLHILMTKFTANVHK